VSSKKALFSIVLYRAEKSENFVKSKKAPFSTEIYIENLEQFFRCSKPTKIPVHHHHHHTSFPFESLNYHNFTNLKQPHTSGMSMEPSSFTFAESCLQMAGLTPDEDHITLSEEVCCDPLLIQKWLKVKFAGRVH
jgi:hypothetical protein